MGTYFVEATHCEIFGVDKTTGLKCLMCLLFCIGRRDVGGDILARSAKQSLAVYFFELIRYCVF